MNTQIRLKMKLTTAILVFCMAASTMSMAKGSWGNSITGEAGYFDQPDFSFEDWMVDPAEWTGGNTTIMTDREEVLPVESWMVKPDSRFGERTAGEGAIQLEGWMTDVARTGWRANSSEPEIILESWMYDLTSW